MSTVTITLTEDEARAFLSSTGPKGDGDIAPVHRAIRAAMKPEHAEGAIAWLTTYAETRPAGRTMSRLLCTFHEGAWRIGSTRVVPIGQVIGVELLRVLGDDEIAVPQPDLDGVNLRSVAQFARRGGYVPTPDWLDRVADVLDGLDR